MRILPLKLWLYFQWIKVGLVVLVWARSFRGGFLNLVLPLWFEVARRKPPWWD